jgi:GntR family transcriptional regulator, transcriptional repressor for pyruvate dehydrogenase complex
VSRTPLQASTTASQENRSERDPTLAAVLLRPVRATNAFEATVEQLGTAIRLGVFAAGDRLPPERELARSMHVSRATLREAIAALRQARLVTTRSGRGGGTLVAERPSRAEGTDGSSWQSRLRTVVAATPEHYREALVTRRVIEPGTAAVAANNDLTPRERGWLRETLHAVDTADSQEEYRLADSRLHLAVAKLSGSSRLLGLVADVQRDLHDMLAAIPVLAVNIAHSNDEHRRIVDAVLAGDPEQAHDVMECHCDGTAGLLRGLLGVPYLTPRRDGNLS